MKTDAQLHKVITDELKWEPSINDREITVKVENSKVTLTGHAHSYAEKCDIERVARDVSGGCDLRLEIEVWQNELSKRKDAEIARSIEKVLGWTSCQPSQMIKVTVENGWVTLSGEVDWPYKIWATAQAIRYVSGVTGVCNLITLKRFVKVEDYDLDNDSKLDRYGMPKTYQMSVVVNGYLDNLSVGAHSFYQKSAYDEEE